VSALGAEWESQLDALHERYRIQGRALVFRLGPPVRLLSAPGRSGIATVRVLGRGPPDYAVYSSGSAFVFDAKECHQRRWPLAKLHAHQAEAFAGCARQGIGAYVLLRMAARTVLLPWSALGPVWQRWHEGSAGRGEASLSLEEAMGLSAWSSGSIDYLDAMRSA